MPNMEDETFELVHVFVCVFCLSKLGKTRLISLDGRSRDDTIRYLLDLLQASVLIPFGLNWHCAAYTHLFHVQG